MSIFGIGLSTIIAICFAIHAIRTGQERYWLFVLFIFPFLGSIVYCFAIFIPSLRSTRSGYHVESQLRKALNPHKTLRDARHAYELSPTVDAHIGLANALVDSGQVEEALPHYESALTGIYKDAPDILLQYAQALYQAKQFIKARQVLDQLRQTNPTYRSDEGHLLYAKILVELDDRTAANEEFDALIGYYPSLEATVCYIDTLIRWGEIEQAKSQLQQLDLRLKTMPKHAKKLNRAWITQAQRLKLKV